MSDCNMLNRVLYIELFQPFAQYRNPFTFYYAQTYPLPPKSTIIGMLQNAVGEYYKEDLWSLQVSIHGGFESTFWNYQSLIKGEVSISKIGLVNKHKRNPLGNSWHPVYHYNITAQRTPVYQQELFNGCIYIFLRGNKELLENINDALSKPKKTLYLGRSEDVVFIRRVEFLDKSDYKPAKKSIWLRYPMYIKRYIVRDGKRIEFPIKNQKYPVYSIPVTVKFYNNGTLIKHKAEITKTTERHVDFQPVIYTGFDYIIKLRNGDRKIEIKYEEFEIDGNKFKIPCEFGWL